MARTKMDIYIIFIIFIKILFILASFTHVFLTHFSKTGNPDLDAKMIYWKERTEFIFTILMALLLIIVFNPHTTHTAEEIDTEMKLLMFLFGWILIITAKWKVFFEETKWLSYFISTKTGIGSTSDKNNGNESH